MIQLSLLDRGMVESMADDAAERGLKAKWQDFSVILKVSGWPHANSLGEALDRLVDCGRVERRYVGRKGLSGRFAQYRWASNREAAGVDP